MGETIRLESGGMMILLVKEGQPGRKVGRCRHHDVEEEVAEVEEVVAQRKGLKFRLNCQ